MRLLSIILATVSLIAVAACSSPTPTPRPTPTPTPTSQGGTQIRRYSKPPEMSIDPNKGYVAILETTKGTIKLELFASEAPKTVNNFVFLARDGFYDGVKFHRIIKDFMIQSGDPLGNGTGGPGYTFEDEPVTRDYLPGVMAMANRGANTNGSQFFIMHGAAPTMPRNYTIFGQVTEGMDVVNAIAETPVGISRTDEKSRPLEDVLIKRIAIQESGG